MLSGTSIAVAVAMPKRQLVSRSILSHSIVVERRPAPVAPSTRSASSTSKFEILPLDRTRPIAQPAGPASPDRPAQIAAERRHVDRKSVGQGKSVSGRVEFGGD